MCHLVLLSTLRQDQLYLNYSLLIFVLLKNILSKIPVVESVRTGKMAKKKKRQKDWESLPIFIMA